MAAWVKNRFSDPKHAMATISTTCLTMAALSVGVFFVGLILAK